MLTIVRHIKIKIPFAIRKKLFASGGKWKNKNAKRPNFLTQTLSTFFICSLTFHRLWKVFSLDQKLPPKHFKSAVPRRHATNYLPHANTNLFHQQWADNYYQLEEQSWYSCHHQHWNRLEWLHRIPWSHDNIRYWLQIVILLQDSPDCSILIQVKFVSRNIKSLPINSQTIIHKYKWNGWWTWLGGTQNLLMDNMYLYCL